MLGHEGVACGIGSPSPPQLFQCKYTTKTPRSNPGGQPIPGSAQSSGNQGQNLGLLGQNAGHGGVLEFGPGAEVRHPQPPSQPGQGYRHLGAALETLLNREISLDELIEIKRTT